MILDASNFTESKITYHIDRIGIMFPYMCLYNVGEQDYFLLDKNYWPERVTSSGLLQSLTVSPSVATNFASENLHWRIPFLDPDIVVPSYVHDQVSLIYNKMGLLTPRRVLFSNETFGLSTPGPYVTYPMNCLIIPRNSKASDLIAIFSSMDKHYYGFKDKVMAEPINELSLKQQNTDGRTVCARCGHPIKIPLGFGTNYNHCPVCEA